MTRATKSQSPVKPPTNEATRGEKSKSEEPEEDTPADQSLCLALVRQVTARLGKEMLSRFVERFLLECNSTAARWQVSPTES